jgi:hypothetical protein
VVFYTEKDVKVEKEDVLKGSIAVRKAVSNPRELDVKISFHFKGKYDKWDNYQLFKIK